MKILKFFPIPVIVAILAFIWMMIASSMNFLSWVAFLTWGAYFLAGISTKSAVREAISYSLGILVGVAIVLAATNLGSAFGTFTLPLIVAAAAFIIVYLEIVPWFDMAPGYFIGAAAFFAAGAKPDMTIVLAVWIPGILGLLLGILTGYLRGKVLMLEGGENPPVKQ